MKTKTLQFSKQVCVIIVVFVFAFLLWNGKTSAIGRLNKMFPGTGTSVFKRPPILHTVPEPISNRCTIFRCANRTMDYVQVFSHPSFNYLYLDESEEVRKANIYPAWCRVPHLIQLQKKRHSCVVYADDDVYLNLSRVIEVINALPKDVVLVGTNNKHGRYYNINSGFILFSDLQGTLTTQILRAWRNAMDNSYYHTIEGDKLRDQRALNDVMHCNMTNVFCYHLNEKKRLGLVSHCFSCKDNDSPTGKHDCMVAAKSLVTEWDAAIE